MQPLIVEKIKKMTQPLIDNGFKFLSLYEKGGDSSCVYICRYQKGRDFFDWREVSGSNEINFKVFVDGEYSFPTLKKINPKKYRAFCLKHILLPTTMDEKRKFVAEILVEYIQHTDEFFGIKL